MTRMYVIMKDDGNTPEPYDVVPDMDTAESICLREEARAAARYQTIFFYWREVISSRDWRDKYEQSNHP